MCIDEGAAIRPASVIQAIHQSPGVLVSLIRPQTGAGRSISPVRRSDTLSAPLNIEPKEPYTGGGVYGGGGVFQPDLTPPRGNVGRGRAKRPLLGRETPSATASSLKARSMSHPIELSEVSERVLAPPDPECWLSLSWRRPRRQRRHMEQHPGLQTSMRSTTARSIAPKAAQNPIATIRPDGLCPFKAAMD